MLCVNKGTGAANFLSLCDNLEREGGLSGRLRPIDLDNTTPGQTTDTQRNIQPQGPCGYSRDFFLGSITETHHRALTKLTFNLR